MFCDSPLEKPEPFGICGACFVDGLCTCDYRPRIPCSVHNPFYSKGVGAMLKEENNA
jgi:hypothetical protein